MALTQAQHDRLKSLSARYGVDFDPEEFLPAYDLPDGWVAGWIGGNAACLYVGCSPEGEIHS